ncbi:hypothetical protein EZS27_036774, partial [termite gut metagenome]
VEQTERKQCAIHFEQFKEMIFGTKIDKIVE